MILNNIIYAVGGFNSSTYVTTVEAFTPPEATTPEPTRVLLGKAFFYQHLQFDFRLPKPYNLKRTYVRNKGCRNE
jgi:hypothetical protein